MSNLDSNVKDRISIDPGVLGGKPTIRGTRVPVSLILNLLAHDYSFDRIREAYPYISEDDIRAALTYAETHIESESPSRLAS